MRLWPGWLGGAGKRDFGGRGGATVLKGILDYWGLFGLVSRGWEGVQE